MTTPADLQPGQSVFDHDQPQQARYLHSAAEADGGLWLVRWGHPDGDPVAEDLVPAGKEYEVIADSDGNRL
jgi:hypothetical protein